MLGRGVCASVEAEWKLWQLLWSVAVRVGEEKGRFLFAWRTQGLACELGGFLVVPKRGLRGDF